MTSGQAKLLEKEKMPKPNEQTKSEDLVSGDESESDQSEYSAAYQPQAVSGKMAPDLNLPMFSSTR